MRLICLVAPAAFWLKWTQRQASPSALARHSRGLAFLAYLCTLYLVQAAVLHACLLVCLLCQFFPPSPFIHIIIIIIIMQFDFQLEASADP